MAVEFGAGLRSLILTQPQTELMNLAGKALVKGPNALSSPTKNPSKRFSSEGLAQLNSGITTDHSNISGYLEANNLTKEPLSQLVAENTPLQLLFFRLKLKVTILTLSHLYLITNLIKNTYADLRIQDQEDMFASCFDHLSELAQDYNPSEHKAFGTFARSRLKIFANHWLNPKDNQDQDQVEVPIDPEADFDPETNQVLDEAFGKGANRKKVLRLRFVQDQTLEAIGQQLGLTRERIRQIEAKAVRRLGDSPFKFRLSRHQIDIHETDFHTPWEN